MSSAVSPILCPDEFLLQEQADYCPVCELSDAVESWWQHCPQCGGAMHSTPATDATDEDMERLLGEALELLSPAPSKALAQQWRAKGGQATAKLAQEKAMQEAVRLQPVIDVLSEHHNNLSELTRRLRKRGFLGHHKTDGGARKYLERLVRKGLIQLN